MPLNHIAFNSINVPVKIKMSFTFNWIRSQYVTKI